jgi:hypothetical protein
MGEKPPDFLQCKQYRCQEEVAMPKSLCRGCNQTFTSLSAFDMHRTGKFERKKRRCLTEQEMLARGMVQNAKSWWMRSAFDGALPWLESEDEQEEAS